ncbi:MAG: hypothetical protein HY308_11395 [Gammaproteobacteria bacterium]|nr:hypothetical protein [Gammaproteobacteria bacterium]
MSVNRTADFTLLRSYNPCGERYTCYPPSDCFRADFDVRIHEQQLRDRGRGLVPVSELALYVGDPRRQRSRNNAANDCSAELVNRELRLVAERVLVDRTVSRVDCRAVGGGELMALAGRDFDLHPSGAYTAFMELGDASADRVVRLVAQGFNHLRIDARCAPGAAADLKEAVDSARGAGFKTVDIVSDFPSVEAGGSGYELADIIAARADSVRWQAPAPTPVPSANALDVQRATLQVLDAAGYVYLGMDHFALPEHELAQARRQGRLHFGVRGYCAGHDCDWIGLGPDAISKIGSTYCRNEDNPVRYSELVDCGRLPIKYGVVLSQDDMVRQSVIHSLINHLSVSFEAIGMAYLIDFAQYFASELSLLEAFAHGGHVELNHEWITVMPHGRLLLPAVCGVFDRYRRDPAW